MKAINTKGVYVSLPAAFTGVVTWYMEHLKKPINGGICLVTSGVTDNPGFPVEHYVVVDNCDSHRLIVATLTPREAGTGPRGDRIEWVVAFHGTDHPDFFISKVKQRGCTERRYSREEAVSAFKEHCEKNFPGWTTEFVGTAPGRIVARRYPPNSRAYVFYGALIETQYLETGFFDRQKPEHERTYGISIIG